MNREIEQILDHVRKKQLALTNIFRITKEVEECFRNNDTVGADHALDLRMEEILSAQECDEEIEQIFDRMDTTEALRLTKIMRLQAWDIHLKAEEKTLFEIYTNIKTIVDKTIEIDRKMSRRIGGYASVYHKSEEVN
ncbi:MAG: hypothetical protein Q4A75_03030 [Peptostreptococcaceae bacterium]|nr:hypothetical protein [Peptostreptococcaceae bacterium]